MVKTERQGEKINQDLLKSSINILVEMGKKAMIVTTDSNFYEHQRHIKFFHNKSIYKTHFEDEFIKETITFYEKEANEYIKNKEVIEYLKIAVLRFQEESDRLQSYLDPSTKKALIKALINCYITNHTKEILIVKEKGLNYIITNNLSQDFKRLVLIFKECPESFAKL